MRRPIERERKAHACNNCFRFNHKMDKCPYCKQCRKCGNNDHIATECKEKKETLMLTCGYCRIKGHKSKDCGTRREEEKSERINYRKSQQMIIKTVWQERAKFTTKSKNSTNENTSQSDNTTTDMSSLSNTIKPLENIRK